MLRTVNILSKSYCGVKLTAYIHNNTCTSTLEDKALINNGMHGEFGTVSGHAREDESAYKKCRGVTAMNDGGGISVGRHIVCDCVSRVNEFSG
jgi:hypothetical protein